MVNGYFKKDLEILYGVGSSVNITEVKKCTTNKSYLINCKLVFSDTEKFQEVGSDGISHLISESWVYTGYGNEKIVVNLSYDIL